MSFIDRPFRNCRYFNSNYNTRRSRRISHHAATQSERNRSSSSSNTPRRRPAPPKSSLPRGGCLVAHALSQATMRASRRSSEAERHRQDGEPHRTLQRLALVALRLSFEAAVASSELQQPQVRITHLRHTGTQRKMTSPPRIEPRRLDAARALSLRAENSPKRQAA